jgi:hypothetical protein
MHLHNRPALDPHRDWGLWVVTSLIGFVYFFT